MFGGSRLNVLTAVPSPRGFSTCETSGALIARRYFDQLDGFNIVSAPQLHESETLGPATKAIWAFDPQPTPRDVFPVVEENVEEFLFPSQINHLS
jgi:hypothetical protein